MARSWVGGAMNRERIAVIVIFVLLTGLMGGLAYLFRQVLPVWTLAVMIISPLVCGIVLFFLVGRKVEIQAISQVPQKEPEVREAREERSLQEMKPQEAFYETISPEAYAAALVGIFQREGRLIDFLNENLDSYDDAQIGAAVRTIHRGLKTALFDLVELAPVIQAKEGTEIVVEEGFNPKEIRLIGNVKGKPPFKGVLRHHGWRLIRFKLPKPKKDDVIAPAEVEIL